MPQPEAESKLASWKVPQISLEIEYSPAVLGEIAAAARASLIEAPPGELEIGGVLFGEHDEGCVRIHTWRPIDCQHTDGPALRLLARDRVELACMLELARRSEDLKDLKPVGWFVSHPRSAVRLTASDLEIFNGFFPYPWQVTLALHPVSEGRIRAGFFVREATGSLKSDASYREFEIEPGPTPAPARPEAEPIFSWAGASSSTLLPGTAQPASALKGGALSTLRETAHNPIGTEPVVFSEQRSSNRSRVVWLGAIAILCVLGVGALILKQRAAPHYDSFALRVLDSRQTLQVDWDRNSPLIQQARAAVMDIRDGGKSTRYALSSDELRAGTMSYVRQSDEVDLVMTVYPPTGPSVQGVGRLLAARTPAGNNPAAETPPAAPAAAAPSEDLGQLRAERDALRTQVIQLEEAVRKEAAEKNRLQDLVRILENRLNLAGNANSGNAANANK